VVFVVALVVAVVLTPVMAVVARRLGVVDRPGPLKRHAAPVPYLGGVAVFGALAAALAPCHPRLLLPLGLALTLGVVDDVHPQPVALRIVGELAVGAAAGWAVPVPVTGGEVLTAIAAIGLLNAVNLIDGMDALAGSVTVVICGGFALLGGAGVDPALALMGAALGFLVFNRPPARIYLGDGGAYLVGTALALLAALAVDSDRDVATWAALPLLVGVPVVDTLVAFARRIRARKPLFVGDRAHVYDQLVDRGAAPVTTVVALAGAQAVLSALGLGVAELPDAWAVVATVASATALAAGARIAGFVTPPDPSTDTSGAL
jgi:UDP-GlcNAc:undecaprenyl-phosphate GlcNAc-1-phosphate transferase